MHNMLSQIYYQAAQKIPDKTADTNESSNSAETSNADEVTQYVGST